MFRALTSPDATRVHRSRDRCLAELDTAFAFAEQEVRPHVPDAWTDQSNTKIGYEIPLNRHFYKYQPPRTREVIEGEIKQLEREIVEMLAEVTRSANAQASSRGSAPTNV
jgi:hypothetical protein